MGKERREGRGGLVGRRGKSSSDKRRHSGAVPVIVDDVRDAMATGCYGVAQGGRGNFPARLGREGERERGMSVVRGGGEMKMVVHAPPIAIADLPWPSVPLTPRTIPLR